MHLSEVGDLKRILEAQTRSLPASEPILRTQSPSSTHLNRTSRRPASSCKIMQNSGPGEQRRMANRRWVASLGLWTDASSVIENRFAFFSRGILLRCLLCDVFAGKLLWQPRCSAASLRTVAEVTNGHQPCLELTVEGLQLGITGI